VLSNMATKDINMSVRSDADLQAIQTSVAFKNISDAVEQYRRQFFLAFLALVAFSAVHVGLVVIANLYTMQTRVNQGQLTDASDSTRAVGTAMSVQTFDLGFIMSNMDGETQMEALNSLESASFVDNMDNYRQYTVTGFQLGGYKRSELKLYTSVGHILEYVRGKGLRVYTETGTENTCNCTRPESRRSLLKAAADLGEVSTLKIGDHVYTFTFDTYAGTQAMGNSWVSSALADSKGDETNSKVYTERNGIDGKVKAYDLKTGKMTLCIGSDARCIRNAMFEFGRGTDAAAISAAWMGVQGNRDLFKANLQSNVDAGITKGLYDLGKALLDMKPDQYESYKVMLEEDHAEREDAYTALLQGQTWVKTERDTGVNTAYHTISRERDVHVRAYNYVGSFYFMHDMAEHNTWTGATHTGTGLVGRGFACTNRNDYSDGNTGIAESLGKNEKGDPGKTCEATEAGGNMMGGYFFSSALGTYEAFLSLLPAKYCDIARNTNVDDLAALNIPAFFLYYLHGWGESAGALVELKTFLVKMQSQDLSRTGGKMIHGDLVLVAPDDNATPFGGRTWYRNSDFTGYHMDMIAWELPTFITDSTGLTAYANGLFGCSMGGAGSLSILMTYPDKYVGAVPFNAPTETNECISYGVCHLECLVDAYMCELVWTSPGVAYNPYVIVTAGNELSTTGYYQPFALGIAERTRVQEVAVGTCMNVGKGKITTVATGTGGRLHNSVRTEGKETVEQMLSSKWVYAPVTSTATPMFWLDPIWFTVVTQGFYPTHNIYTDDEDCVVIKSLLDRMPLWRLKSDVLDGGKFIFMSTDSNDEFGIAAMANRFVGELIKKYDPTTEDLTNNSFASNGSFYEDTFGLGGHTMSTRDFKTAVQFFSDVIANGITQSRDKDNQYTGEHTVNTLVSCPTYLKADEIVIEQQSTNAIINYSGLNRNCPDSRYVFNWGRWGTDGDKKIPTGGNPVDMVKYNNVKGLATESECKGDYIEESFPTS